MDYNWSMKTCMRDILGEGGRVFQIFFCKRKTEAEDCIWVVVNEIFLEFHKLIWYTIFDLKLYNSALRLLCSANHNRVRYRKVLGSQAVNS